MYTQGVLLNNWKNKILSFSEKWMEQEDIMLSDIKQIQKDKYHMFSLIGGS
jgi:hypothetical protein